MADLPPGIDDVSLNAILQAAREELAAIDRTVLLLQDFDNVVASALPALASGNGITAYEGWLLATTDEERRDLIKRSYELHRKKGTLFSIREAVAQVGYEAMLEKWYQYGGDPYHIRVALLDVSQKGLDAETYDLILNMVREFKAARTILDTIRVVNEARVTYHLGAKAYTGTTIWAVPAYDATPIETSGTATIGGAVTLTEHLEVEG